MDSINTFMVAEDKVNVYTIRRLLITIMTIFLISVLASCSAVTHSTAGTTTTIILTRHGDRDPLSKLLNDKGRERAAALVEAVGDMNIAAIYSPDIKRNLDTVEPLAKYLGIEIHVVGARPSSTEVTKTMLTRHAGEVVLWVGNTDNLEGIYSLLGGKGPAPTFYGDLFIMKIKDSDAPEVIKKRYGPS